MNSRYRLALILGFLFTAACGQSGPLYLPGDPSEIRTDAPPPPQTETETEEDDEDKEKEPRENN